MNPKYVMTGGSLSVRGAGDFRYIAFGGNEADLLELIRLANVGHEMEQQRAAERQFAMCEIKFDPKPYEEMGRRVAEHVEKLILNEEVGEIECSPASGGFHAVEEQSETWHDREPLL